MPTLADAHISSLGYLWHYLWKTYSNSETKKEFKIRTQKKRFLKKLADSKSANFLPNWSKGCRLGV